MHSLIRLFSITALGAALAALPACYSFHDTPRRQSMSPEPLSADAWSSIGDDEAHTALRALANNTPNGLVRLNAPDESFEPTPNLGRSRLRAREVLAIQHDDFGLLRHWHEPGETDVLPYPDRFFDQLLVVRPNASFLMPARLARLQAQREATAAVFATDPDAAPSRFPGLGVIRTEQAEIYESLDDGLPLRLPTEVAEDTPGIVLYLPAVFSNIYEYAVVEAFQDRGWSMLFIDSNTRVRQPTEVAYADANARRSLEFQRRLRAAQAGLAEGDQPRPLSDEEFAELARLYPPPPSGFELTAWNNPADLGRAIAAAVDELLIEHALAAEASLRFLHSRHPHLADKPIIILGFSGGSLGAPAVTARLREAFPSTPFAIVLVGSGGDLLSASIDSNVTDGGITIVPEGETLPAEARQQIVAAYREASHLDPLRVIKSLRDLPVLHVYATRDQAVSTATARALNEAHGTPARLVYTGGHRGLFYFLPSQKNRIVRWAEQAVREQAKTTPK